MKGALNLRCLELILNIGRVNCLEIDPEMLKIKIKLENEGCECNNRLGMQVQKRKSNRNTK